MFPFHKPKGLFGKVKEAFQRLSDRTRLGLKRLPSAGYYLDRITYKLGKFRRGAGYAIEDAKIETKKMSKHTEAFLFSIIIILALAMLLRAGSSDFISSLIALLVLVLVVVIYMQLKFQKRMLDQYVPRLEFVRISKCQFYSDRIRTVNLYGAKEKLDRIKKVRNLKIGYDIINDSFTPLSIHSASVIIKVKGGKSISLPSAMSVVNVEPKRTSSSGVSFRLPREVDFDSIDWVELSLKGNADKKILTEPHLYVNIVTRGKKPKFIFEPFDKFRKRPEIASG